MHYMTHISMDFKTEMQKLEGFTDEQQKEWDYYVEDLSNMSRILLDYGAVQDAGFENENSHIYVIILNDEMHWDNVAFEDKLEGLKATHYFVLGVYSSVLNMVYHAEKAEIARKEQELKKSQEKPDPASFLILPQK